MLDVFRRATVTAALGLWLGGLTFYGAVVIRVATRVLGSHTRVGFITQGVVGPLNLLGWLALGIALLDLLRSRSWLRWTAWGAAAAAHGALYAVKPRMDALLDPRAMDITDHERFYRLHQVYLALTTVEWAAGLVLLVLALAAWRRQDLERRS